MWGVSRYHPHPQSPIPPSMSYSWRGPQFSRNVKAPKYVTRALLTNKFLKVYIAFSNLGMRCETSNQQFTTEFLLSIYYSHISHKRWAKPEPNRSTENLLDKPFSAKCCSACTLNWYCSEIKVEIEVVAITA